MVQEPTSPHEEVIERRCRKAVKDAVRAYQRNAIIGFLILLAGIGGAIYLDGQHNSDQREQILSQGQQQDKAIVASGDAVAVAGCNRDYRTIDSLRDELERSLLRIDSLEADGTYSKHQADVGREATRDILARYKLPDCRRADDILTTKPGEVPTAPEARYPDDPQQRADEERETKELGQPSDVP